MATKDKELTTPESEGYLVTLGDTDAVRELIDDNLGGDSIDRFSLTRIKIPTGGNIAWTVPRLTGPEPEKEIAGVIPYWRTTRAYWKTPYGEGETGDAPPDCSSQDGHIGEGDPGGECNVCPLNQWDSDPKETGGKACKEIRSIFLLEETALLPFYLPIPPTSIPLVKAYFMNLASNGINYWRIVTAFTLEATKNKTGIVYSRAVPRFVRHLSDEEVAVVMSYRNQIRPALEAQIQVVRSEVDSPELS